jgi:hypothetical protein
MHDTRVVATIAMTACLMALGLACTAAPQTAESATRSERKTPVDQTFQVFLAKVDAAQLELQNGKPDAFKALWSHAEDATLSGGFGGTIEQGWQRIGPRLDWVGAQFSQGTNAIERLVTHVSGDVGYVVQIEHIRFTVPGQAGESTRDYRVTMLFRRESSGWRIVHRQADSQMTKQAPQ